MYLTCITITQSTIVTGPIGFNIGLTNVNARLSNVVSTLYQRCVTLFRRCVTLFRHCFNVGHWRCINIVQRWKSDVGFCFIFNVGSTLFQLWSTTLKQRWSDVEMLARQESDIPVKLTKENSDLFAYIFWKYYP